MSQLSRISIHPIKGLDPESRSRVEITDVGGLSGDRQFAMVADDGGYVNGKRTAAVHQLRSNVDLETRTLTLRVEGDDDRHDFHLDRDRTDLETWLSAYFDVEVTIEEASGGEQTDGAVYGDGSKTGPTLIAHSTLHEVASWYEGIDANEIRRRLRPNLVIEGVEPFWEDRLVADGGRRIRIGDVVLEGVDPVPRCVVPTRHPRTGEPYEGFRETFVHRREDTLPDWVDRSAFDENLYSLMASCRIPREERDGELVVGSAVRLEGSDQG